MTTLTRRDVAIGLSALAVLPALPALAATDHPVTIQGMKFAPAALSVKPGDSVTFTNMDAAPHTATSDAGAFDTGRLGKGKAATVTFTAKGDFPYHCAVHPSMKAMIRVG